MRESSNHTWQTLVRLLNALLKVLIYYSDEGSIRTRIEQNIFVKEPCMDFLPSEFFSVAISVGGSAHCITGIVCAYAHVRSGENFAEIIQWCFAKNKNPS